MSPPIPRPPSCSARSRRLRHQRDQPAHRGDPSAHEGRRVEAHAEPILQLEEERKDVERGEQPGCEQVEQVSPTEYKSIIKMNIAGISGRYKVYIKLLETDQPRFCRMQGEVDGPTGAINGEADFELEPVREQTKLTYHGSALITGALGKLNPRFFEGVAKSLIKQGLDKLNKQVTLSMQEK